MTFIINECHKMIQFEAHHHFDELHFEAQASAVGMQWHIYLFSAQIHELQN